MQKYIVLLSFLISFQILGNDLTISESNDLSTDLDNICGDTWCGGDFNWSVENFTCSFKDKTCSVDLTLIDEFYFDDDYGRSREDFFTLRNHVSRYLEIETESDTDYLALSWRQTCTFNNIQSKDELFDLSGWSNYSDMVYDRVLDCVTDIEQRYWEVTDNL